MIAITGDPEERYEWAQRGIEMAERGDLRGWLGALWNNLGWDYVAAERYDEAREALEKAREYHYEGEGEIPKLVADYSVAHVMRLQGNVEQAAEAMRQVFDRAVHLQNAGNAEAIEWIGFSRWELAEIAVVRGEIDVGVNLMRAALTELREAGMPDWDAADWERRQARVAELTGQ
jgi:tetratricopeptide (TPR) repeat protein